MTIKVCVIQDSPVFFDKEKSMEKVSALVREYSSKGCRLILFPESFIPGYPRGLSFGAVVGNRSNEGRDLFQIYHRESFDSSGPEMARLEALSREYGCYIVMGATEKTGESATLYCSMLYISPTEGLMGIHRKIKPTASERLIWGESDGKDLVTFNTQIGRLGGLICWENYMPLARMSMFMKNIQIYMAPTADCRDEWIASMIHIAVEGRCFVLSANQYTELQTYPEYIRKQFSNPSAGNCRGGSLIISPAGKIIAGPLYDKAGALVADIDIDDCTRGKMDLDTGGHYNRPDIFNFRVAGQPDTRNEKDNQ